MKFFPFFFAFGGSDVQFINAEANKDLQMKSQLQFENIKVDEFSRLRVELVPAINLDQVQVFITSNPAFNVPQNIFFFKDLSARDEFSLETTIYLNNSQTELIFGEFTLMVSFTNKQSITRVIKHRVEVPLKMILKQTAAQKDGAFKITATLSAPLDLNAVLKGKYRLH